MSIPQCSFYLPGVMKFVEKDLHDWETQKCRLADLHKASLSDQTFLQEDFLRVEKEHKRLRMWLSGYVRHAVQRGDSSNENDCEFYRRCKTELDILDKQTDVLNMIEERMQAANLNPARRRKRASKSKSTANETAFADRDEAGLEAKAVDPAGPESSKRPNIYVGVMGLRA